MNRGVQYKILWERFAGTNSEACGDGKLDLDGVICEGESVYLQCLLFCWSPGAWSVVSLDCEGVEGGSIDS